MDNIKLYEVEHRYIEYMSAFAPHLFLNKQPGQQNERKYIGVVLHIHQADYFAPLSSFKEKHKRMEEGLDFLKIKNYAVINLNNMFPVAEGVYQYIDINTVRNPQYKALLLAEYRIIKSMQEKIRKNALLLYNHKLKHENSTPLTKRCNDFLLLEKACKDYQ